ncbi:MAG TPA: hypothetical protein VKS79_14265 [Gemmataceae bacterium]|nr:hypothetical protein [Gemmataceae bacterium]
MCKLLTICSMIAVTAGVAWADDDPVRVKLDMAKLKYQQDMLKHRRAVLDWMDKREEAARKDGNKRAVELILAERRVFDDKNELPRTAPDEFRQNFLKARAALVSAYETAIKEYIMVKKDYDATLAEKEMAKLKLAPITLVPATVAAPAVIFPIPAAPGAPPAITADMLRAKLAGKSAYDAKTGVLNLTYTFADKKQLDDFDGSVAKAKLEGGELKLESGATLRHIVQFDTLMLTSTVSFPAMRGPVISTSQGTSLFVGGLAPNTVYLNTKSDGNSQHMLAGRNITSASSSLEFGV